MAQIDCMVCPLGVQSRVGAGGFFCDYWEVSCERLNESMCVLDIVIFIVLKSSN